jgi:hypothetical protein
VITGFVLGCTVRNTVYVYTSRDDCRGHSR